jgi:hypothetical protein
MEGKQNKRQVFKKQAAVKSLNVSGYFKRKAAVTQFTHVAKCPRTHS